MRTNVVVHSQAEYKFQMFQARGLVGSPLYQDQGSCFYIFQVFSGSGHSDEIRPGSPMSR